MILERIERRFRILLRDPRQNPPLAGQSQRIQAEQVADPSHLFAHRDCRLVEHDLGAASIGEYPWAANEWIDDAVLVDDDQIVKAQRWLWNNAHLAIEPAAATTMAALLTGTYVPEPGERVVAVLSGANVDPGSIL